MNIKTKIAVLFLTIASLAALAANPTMNIYLEDWSRQYQPVHETCTGIGCGSGYAHPQFTHIFSTYHEYDNGALVLHRETYTDPGPIYHHTCTVTENWSSTNTVGSKVTACSDSGSTTNAPWSFSVDEDWVRGEISFVTHESSYDNTKSVSDDCKIVLKYAGGSSGYVYTYRLYFQVWEIIYNASGNEVDNGLIPYNQISVPSKTVYNGSAHGAGYAYIVVSFNGGAASTKVNITPSTAKPRYGISAFEVELYSVVEK